MKICSFLRVGALAVPAVWYPAFAAENAAAQAGAGMPGSPQNGHDDLEPHTAVTEETPKETGRESRKRSSSAVVASRTPHSLGWSKSVGGLASALLAATAVLSFLGKGNAASKVEEELSTETASQALLPKSALPKVLTGLVLLGVIASALATPLTERQGRQRTEEAPVRDSVDHLFVKGLQESTLIQWEEGQGETQIGLTFGNKNYKLHLSDDIEYALFDTDHLNALKSALTESPRLVRETYSFVWEWGKETDPIFFQMPMKAMSLDYRVRLPAEVIAALEETPGATVQLDALLQKFFETATSPTDAPRPDGGLLTDEERHKTDRHPPAYRVFNNDNTKTWVLGRGWGRREGGYKDGQHAFHVKLKSGVNILGFFSRSIEKALTPKLLGRLTSSLSRRPSEPMLISTNTSPDVIHYEVHWGRLNDTTKKYLSIPKFDTYFNFYFPQNVVRELLKKGNEEAKKDLDNLLERAILRMEYERPEVIARVDVDF